MVLGDPGVRWLDARHSMPSGSMPASSMTSTSPHSRSSVRKEQWKSGPQAGLRPCALSHGSSPPAPRATPSANDSFTPFPEIPQALEGQVSLYPDQLVSVESLPTAHIRASPTSTPTRTYRSLHVLIGPRGYTPESRLRPVWSGHRDTPVWQDPQQTRKPLGKNTAHGCGSQALGGQWEDTVAAHPSHGVGLLHHR